MKIDHDLIADIALKIVDSLVEQGIVPDCTDTDDDYEFVVQDIIRDILHDQFNVEKDWN